MKYGVDPNMIYDGSKNIMESLCYVGRYEGADLLSILLDDGGKLDIEIHGERLFDIIDFDVIFGAVEMEERELYDAIVHCWVVMIGYGARLSGGESAIEVFIDDNTGEIFDLTKLKKHRKYSAFLSNALVLEITSLFSRAAGHEKGVKRDDFGLLDVKKR